VGLEGGGWGGCSGAQPLLFDGGCNKKPAYHAMLERMQQGVIDDDNPPGAPGGISAAAGTQPARIEVEWDDAVDDRHVNWYEIYRNGEKITRIQGDKTWFTDFGLAPGVEYEYEIVSIDAAANSSVKSAKASAVFPPVDEGDVVFAVNAGDGAEYEAADGTTFLRDMLYSGGEPWIRGHPSVSGTDDDELFMTRRVATFSYDIPLVAGNYEIVFMFAEDAVSGAGARRFDILAEGEEIASDFDIFSNAGGRDVYYGLSKISTVEDDTLNIRFVAGNEYALLNAFKVMATEKVNVATRQAGQARTRAARLQWNAGRMAFDGIDQGNYSAIVEVYDLHGKRVERLPVYKTHDALSKLGSGCYLVHLRADGNERPWIARIAD
jgi:hypothetical protein